MTAVTPAYASNTANKSKDNSEAWRKSPPKLSPLHPFTLPSVLTYKLNNGLTVCLVEDHRVPFITVNLGLKVGTACDPNDKHGLAALVADMLTEGTVKRSSKDIADQVDFIGGALHGASDLDFTLIVGSALSKYTDQLFNVISDIVINPTFPENELTLKKTNLIQELILKRSQPSFLQEERFSQVTFGKHPYSVVAPNPENVEKITKNDLQNFYKQYFLPNAAILVVVGDFTTNQMKRLIEADLGTSWHLGQIREAKYPTPPSYHGRRIYIVDRPGSVQSSIKLGNVAINKTNPDYFPLLVANQILGGAAHSRLFLNIRENKGFTYGAYSSFAARRDPGAFAAEAEVRTEVTAPALQEFLYELDRLRNLPVTDKELQDAKNYLSGSFVLGLETQSGLAQRLLEEKLYNLPDNYLETYTNKIMAITPDDVRTVARKDIDLDNINIVVVGDSTKIKHDLQYFAPTELFNSAGTKQ